MTSRRFSLLLGGVAFGAVTLSACAKPELEKTETTAAVPVSVETAVRGRIESTISATGVITPLPGGDRTITAPEAARIAELPKAEGDTVAVGDVLVRFDIPTLPAELAAKQAGVAQARVQVSTAIADVGRLAPLVDKGIAAQRQLEEAKRTQADAEAALAQAESAVTAAKALSDRAVIRSTFAGVVAKRWHNAGDFVEGAASDPVLRVIDVRTLQIVASISVADIPRVIPGRTGFVIGPSGEGELVRVLTRPAQVDATTTMAEVRLAFTKATQLTAGTSVQIVLVGESHDNAVIIPASAIVYDDDEVFVMVIDKDNKAHRHDVVVGLTSPDKVEILSGVAAGEVVAFRGQDEAPDGGTVTIVK